jgi:uncharacterized protein (TIGR02677 family)
MSTIDLTAERLRLFAFTAAPEAARHLEILRAFERARDRFSLSLTPEQVGGDLAGGPVDEAQLVTALDQLSEWGLLQRTRDEGRVRNLAEYRRRRAVYQLTVIGYQALLAVEKVLRHELSDTELRRLAFRTVLEALRALHEATLRGDGEQVLVQLERVHGDLEDLATRAAAFQLLVHQLASSSEAEAVAFLDLKERLLGHLQAFLEQLQRFSGELNEAVRALDEVGAAGMIELAVQADRNSLFEAEARRERLTRHWQGVRAWFLDDTSSSRSRDLQRDATHAIRALAGLLRRVMNARRGGLGRARQLEHLAAWFDRQLDDASCHALFQASFRLRPAVHLQTRALDPELVRAQTPWREAPPEPISGTLRAHGRTSTVGRPSALRDDTQATARLLAEQAARRAEAAELSGALARVHELREPLTQAQFRLLTRLIGRALRVRAGPRLPRAARLGGVRLVLTPFDGLSRVRAEHGELDVIGWKVDVERAEVP